MRGSILFTGAGSRICTELYKIIPTDVGVVTLTGRRDGDMSSLATVDEHAELISRMDRIVVCHGWVDPYPFLDRSQKSVANSLMVNLVSAVRICEIALTKNPSVRICVIGSESGIKGSFDVPYWLSKAALHSYVKERRLEHPGQQIVAVAPSTIVDSRMTQDRHDQDRVERSCRENPKGRGVTSREVAKMIHFLLFEDEGYTTNVVIEMTGGKFARSG